MSEAGVRDRTREAFQELTVAELPGLYSLARRLVRDGAEDLVQEALLQAYRAFGSLRENAAAGRWLKTILVNVFPGPAPEASPLGRGALRGEPRGLLPLPDRRRP